MVTRIGGIVVDIDARLAKLEKELERGNRELRKFEKTATASGSRVEQGLVGIGKGVGALVGTLGGLGIALGATELIGFARSALAMGDDLATAADQAGIGVERFQTLRQAFRELEIDGDQFDKAMLRLVTTLGDVQSGASDGATAALDKMGITARILSGEIDTTDELLDAIAGSSRRFGTEAEFTSAVVDIFGRRVGVQMAAALRDGGVALHGIESDVKSLGTVLTEEQINKLADANEVVDRFTEAASYKFAIWSANVVESIGSVSDAWNELQRYLSKGVTLAGGGLVDDRRITAISNQTNAARAELAKRAEMERRNPPNFLQQLANSNRNSHLKNVISEGERELSGLIAAQRKLASATSVVTPVAISRPSGGGGGGGAPRRSGGGGSGAREADTFARTMADLARQTADARMEFTQLNDQWDDVTIVDAEKRAEALRREQEEGVKWTTAQRSAHRAAAEDVRYWAVQLALLKQNQEAFNVTLSETDFEQYSSLSLLEGQLERIANTVPDLRSRWDIAMAGLDDSQGIAFDGLTRNLEGALLGFQSLEDAAKNFGKQLLSLALQKLVFEPLGAALKIPGYAGGTNSAPGGMAIVGEEGPELVNLPRGAQVIPNNRLRGMSNPLVQSVGNGGANVVHQSITFSGAVDLATRQEVYRIADLTKKATMAAMGDGRRRGSR